MGSVIEDYSFITPGLCASMHIEQLLSECLWLLAINKSDYRCLKLMNLHIIMAAVPVKLNERQEKWSCLEKVIMDKIKKVS